MPLDLQKLKAAAEAATPGPWRARYGDELINAEGEVFAYGSFLSDDDPAFIAAANPSVVLALIAEIERITKVCEAHGHALQLAAQAAGLLAGADAHRDLVPAIEQLNKRIQDLEDDMPARYV